MAIKQIYGNFQTAGIPVTGTGKSVPASDGTSPLAQLVALVDSSGVLIPSGNSAINITTATTTTVKSGAGVFASLNVNTGGASSTATVYDNTAGSGTKLGTFSTATQGVFPVNLAFATGLTVVTANGTPADITIAYR